ncbi:MAG: hypothetical protein FWF51_13310 [Chitinivibrionia bacterium]|nr:hypothetical protein [Chitinivibrionia bacterium]
MRNFLKTMAVVGLLCATSFAQENAQERYEHYKKMKNVGTGLILGGVAVGTTGVITSVIHALDAVDKGTYMEYFNLYGTTLYYEYDGKRYYSKTDLDAAVDDVVNPILAKSAVWMIVGNIGYTAMIAGIPIRIVGRVKANEWKSKLPSAVYISPNSVKLTWKF